MKLLDYDGLEYYNNLVENKYLPKSGGTLTGNVYTTPYYDSTIVDPEGGQTLIVSKGKVAKGTAPSSNEWHTMVMAVDNSGLTSNANKYGQVETAVKTDGSVETVVQAYKNEANSTTSAKISVGYDANGNAFTSAPTPAAGDDSTKIATTAWVRDVAALAGHTHSYLPLSGGTLTGDVTMNKSNPHIFLKDTAIARGTAPSANNTPVNILASDKNGKSTWGLYHRYNTDKSNRIDLIAYKGTTTDSTWTSIGVGYDGSGNAYTYAPTPAQTDDSTKIATTAYVKDCVPKSIGSATKPVYTNSNGVITACTYSLEKSVPSNAVFTDTKYSNMTAATASAAGKAGLVPAPAAGKQASFLRGDGTWVVPTNTTYANFVKSGSGAKNGLVPAPSTTAGTTKYLREDCTWQVPPNTNNISATGTNYIRFNNKRQICWGTTTVNGYSSSNVTFPVAFSATPTFVLYGSSGYFTSLSSTKVTIHNSYEEAVDWHWIAVGSWS